MNLYAVISKSTFVGDAYVICKTLKEAKDHFDDYSVNPGRTVILEIEPGKDFGLDGDTGAAWGATLVADQYKDPDDWSSLMTGEDN